MKRIGAAGIVLASLLLAGAPAQAEDLDFKLINISSSSVVGVYLSHSGTQDWEANLVPDGSVLPPGNEVDVTIADGRSTCSYDIRIEFQDGTELEEYEIDACELGSYTIEDE